MNVDTSRNGESVHNILTGQTGTVVHAEGGQYLVELDKLTLRGEYRQWWRASHMALGGCIADGASYFGSTADVVADIEETVQWAAVYGWTEAAIDHLEYLTTVKEYEFEGGREAANDGVIRANVRFRLTPQRWVSIPGLGREVPVYAGDAA